MDQLKRIRRIIQTRCYSVSAVRQINTDMPEAHFNWLLYKGLSETDQAVIKAAPEPLDRFTGLAVATSFNSWCWEQLIVD